MTEREGRAPRLPSLRIYYRNDTVRSREPVASAGTPTPPGADPATGDGRAAGPPGEPDSHLRRSHLPRERQLDEEASTASGSPRAHKSPAWADKLQALQFEPFPRRDAVGDVAVRYVVQPGDSLFLIARRFNVPLNRLRAANPELTDDQIFVGQLLEVPLTEPTLPPLPETYEPFVVQPGDTWISVARRFDVSVEALRAANPNLDPDTLIAGTVVFVPTVEDPPPVPIPATLYVIGPGDTLSRVAEAFGVSLADLRTANPQLPGDSVFPGDILAVPTAGIPPQPVFQRLRHVVQAGETLESISQQFGVPLAQLEQVNVFLAAIPGLVIAIPTPIAIPQPPTAPEGFPSCMPAPFGRRLELGDDDSAFVPFPEGFQFRFFGQPVGGGVFVNSNGTLTFGVGDPSFVASTDAFLEGPPRIAGFWTDLIPVQSETPGGVFVDFVEDEALGGMRLVVTFDRVPVFFARDAFQTFQIHLNPDDTISICYFSITPVSPPPGLRTLIGLGGGREHPRGNVFLFNGEENPRRLGPEGPTPDDGLTGRILLYTFDPELQNYRLRFTTP